MKTPTRTFFYRHRAGFLLVALLVLGSGPAAAQTPLTVVGWNLESGGSDPAVVAQRIEAFQDVDLWGFTEVQNAQAAAIFEAASEVGENADFTAVVSESGGGDRMVIAYDAVRFEEVDRDELEDINVGGNVRAPLVVHLRDLETDQELLFMVNHLYRSNTMRRHEQSRLLNQWAQAQTLPVIAVGDYNYDWDVPNGDQDHDLGYDLITAGDVLTWVRPPQLLRTQCTANPPGSAKPCRYNGVLDFVFANEAALAWQPAAEIVVAPNDFPDTDQTTDHRPVRARFVMQPVVPVTVLRQQLLDRIAQIEADLAALRALVEQLR